jgi:hypothetical protein
MCLIYLNNSYYLLISLVIVRHMNLFRDFGGIMKDFQTAKQCGCSLVSFRIITFNERGGVVCLLKWSAGVVTRNVTIA